MSVKENIFIFINHSLNGRTNICNAFLLIFKIIFKRCFIQSIDAKIQTV